MKWCQLCRARNSYHVRLSNDGRTYSNVIPVAQVHRMTQSKVAHQQHRTGCGDKIEEIVPKDRRKTDNFLARKKKVSRGLVFSISIPRWFPRFLIPFNKRREIAQNTYVEPMRYRRENVSMTITFYIPNILPSTYIQSESRIPLQPLEMDSSLQNKNKSS